MPGRVREKERTDERDRRGLWQWILQIAGGIGALLLFFHAVDGQGMIGMVLRYYMTESVGVKCPTGKEQR